MGEIPKANLEEIPKRSFGDVSRTISVRFAREKLWRKFLRNIRRDYKEISVREKFLRKLYSCGIPNGISRNIPERICGGLCEEITLKKSLKGFLKKSPKKCLEKILKTHRWNNYNDIYWEIYGFFFERSQNTESNSNHCATIMSMLQNACICNNPANATN